MQLKYGCSPHQSFASIEPLDPARAPIRVLNGTPSFINFLDALNAWQLVREARVATGLAAALDPAGLLYVSQVRDRGVAVFSIVTAP